MAYDPREVLERLCAERKEDFRTLSRMLGRNTSYIQQFVRRGVPKRLGEEERRKLARYFGVPESHFGGPGIQSAPDGLIAIKRNSGMPTRDSDAAWSEPPGNACIAFEEPWLRDLTPSPPTKLSILRVEDDSMSPTLSVSDDILVDLNDSCERMRDGIYLLRIQDAVTVRRVALNPIGRTATISSDNASYPRWPNCSIDEINPIGRVIWAGHRLR